MSTLDSRFEPIVDHCPIEFVDRQLPHDFDVGGVGLHDMREPTSQHVDGMPV
ncbi:MAG: hypothetical protein WBP28_06470 [Nostocoides sp.]